MGETAAETLNEIAASRSKIEQDLDALDARLPEKEELQARAKQAGIAAGAGVIALVVVWILLRRWRARRAEERLINRHAELLAAALPRAFDQDDESSVPIRQLARVETASSGLALALALVALVVALTGLRRS